ncbi:translation initiation factor IF-2-like [Ixodes scapularis]|uniref:translation initiation factor IF-2-like n=1 Tax=Ixodes scapularis TaxID=6945 RepID=UPI001A9F53F9|nr:translation initiation factor IF-2-like [Ixodes scapularis]
MLEGRVDCGLRPAQTRQLINNVCHRRCTGPPHRSERQTHSWTTERVYYTRPRSRAGRGSWNRRDDNRTPEDFRRVRSGGEGAQAPTPCNRLRLGLNSWRSPRRRCGRLPRERWSPGGGSGLHVPRTIEGPVPPLPRGQPVRGEATFPRLDPDGPGRRATSRLQGGGGGGLLSGLRRLGGVPGGPHRGQAPHGEGSVEERRSGNGRCHRGGHRGGPQAATEGASGASDFGPSLGAPYRVDPAGPGATAAEAVRASPACQVHLPLPGGLICRRARRAYYSEPAVAVLDDLDSFLAVSGSED